jgi:hypothetical protein
MKNIGKIAKDIMSASPVPDVKQKIVVKKGPVQAPVKQVPTKQAPVEEPVPSTHTTISADEITATLEIANDLRRKLGGLLNALEVNIKDLTSSKSSVLRSKDRFKKLKLSLEKMQDNLSVV